MALDPRRADTVLRATGARNWLTPAAWVAAVTAVLLLVFPFGFPNYDTIYALVWGRELAQGMSPDYGAALPPTPHPLTDLFGLVATPLGDGAITVTMIVAYALARPDRLPRLPARRALVRPLDRRRRRRDRPHPRPLPLQRPARLHRPPLHRPLPRRAPDRGQAPPSRLARPSPARISRPACAPRPGCSQSPTWRTCLLDRSTRPGRVEGGEGTPRAGGHSKCRPN